MNFVAEKRACHCEQRESGMVFDQTLFDQYREDNRLDIYKAWRDVGLMEPDLMKLVNRAAQITP